MYSVNKLTLSDREFKRYGHLKLLLYPALFKIEQTITGGKIDKYLSINTDIEDVISN